MTRKIGLANTPEGDLLQRFMPKPVVASYCTTFLKRDDG